MSDNQWDALDSAIANRTGGRKLGEMTGEEIRAAFADGPIMFRDGQEVTE